MINCFNVFNFLQDCKTVKEVFSKFSENATFILVKKIKKKEAQFDDDHL